METVGASDSTHIGNIGLLLAIQVFSLNIVDMVVGLIPLQINVDHQGPIQLVRAALLLHVTCPVAEKVGHVACSIRAVALSLVVPLLTVVVVGPLGLVTII